MICRLRPVSRIRPQSWLLAILAVVSGLSACSRDTEAPYTPDPGDLADAELIAVILDQTIRPSEESTLAIARELTSIREAYGDEIPSLSLSPRPRWEVSTVLLRDIEPDTFMAMQEDCYHAWDGLNQQYGVVDIEVRDSPYSPLVYLRFEGVLHSMLLAEQFSRLPGVGMTWGRTSTGDGPNLYPRRTESGRTYLFREAWGDCMAGCSRSVYSYFRIEDGIVDYVGSWDTGLDPEPVWWPEAKANKDAFLGW